MGISLSCPKATRIISDGKKLVEFEAEEDDQIYLMHMYSKNIEYSEDNLEEFTWIFKINKIFNLD